MQLHDSNIFHVTLKLKNLKALVFPKNEKQHNVPMHLDCFLLTQHNLKEREKLFQKCAT